MGFLFGGGAQNTVNQATQLVGLRIQSSAQGMPIALAYGECRVTPNLGWYGDFTAIPHTQVTQTGGKGGGGSTSTSITYTYTVGAEFMLCEGPISGYGTVYSGSTLATTANMALTEFTGSASQAAWSYLTTNHASQALTYRGQALLAGVVDLGSSDSLPNLSFDVKGLLYGNQCTPDANLSDVLNDLLTNATYGVGFPAAQLGSLSSFNTYCAAAGLLASPLYDQATTTADQMITELMQAGNSAPVWSEGVLKVIPYADQAVSGTPTIPQYNDPSWTVVNNSSNPAGGWNCVRWNGSYFCNITGGLGAGQISQISSDGINWTGGSSGIGSAPSGLAWNGIVWCLVYGNGANATATSSDGLNWTGHSNAVPNITNLISVCSNGSGTFVCVGYGTFAYIASSTDGITWTAHNLGASYSFSSSSSDAVSWNGRVFAVPSGLDVFTSPDGVNWTRNVGVIAGADFILAIGRRLFAPYPGYGTHNNAYSDDDGVTWKTVSITTPFTPGRYSIGSWNGNYAVISTSVYGANLLFSTDGANWQISAATYGVMSLAAIPNGLIFASVRAATAGYFTESSFISCISGSTVTFTPNTTVNYQLTDSDFLPMDPGPVKITRKRQADAFNSVKIECLDRANNYNTAVVEAKDQAAIELYGLRPMSTIQLHMICVPSIARTLAQLILQRALYLRNTYEFIVGWRYARLEPMDLVGITDADLGLSQTTVRVLTIDENDNGDLTMTAEDFQPGTTTAASVATQSNSGYLPNQNTSAGNCVAPVIFQPPSSLTGNPQIWLGTAGQAGSNWGGAQVWASNDGSTYAQVGIVTAPARFGVLTANFPVGADPDVTNNLSVNLTSSSGTLVTATSAQADGENTLSYCDGELVAYSTATLTSAYNYKMSAYIRRGQYGTYVNSHLTNSKFMRLDDAIAKVDLVTAWAGTNVYIKLLSYNNVGNALQALSDVNPTTYAVQRIGLTPADGVLSTIDAQHSMTIPAGYQYGVSHRLTILGRVVNYGRITVT